MSVVCTLIYTFNTIKNKKGLLLNISTMHLFSFFLRRIFFFSLLFFVFCFLEVANANAQYNVGYRSISIWNPKENIRLDISIWYPTLRAPSEFSLDNFIIFGAKNAPILQKINEELAAPVRIIREGISKKADKDGLTAWERLQELKKAPLPFHPLPLILLSHDTGATRFSNHTIAQALASRGYIVAIPMHEGDNAWQMQLANSARALTKRARQISASLDLLLTHESLTSYIDKNNITYLGFGSAGTAGLLLTKASPTAHIWQNYCAENSFLETDSMYSLSPIENLLESQVQDSFHSDKRINPYCLSPLKQIMDELVMDFEIFSEYELMTNTYYDNISTAKKNIAVENSIHLIEYTKLLKRQNPSFKDFIDTPPFIQPYFPLFEKTVSLQDGRFTRMIFVSAGYSMLFEKESLSEIEIPLLFIGLHDDKINLPEYQSEVFVKAINTFSNGNLKMIQVENSTQQDPIILTNLHEEIDLATEALMQSQATHIPEKRKVKTNAQHSIIYHTDIWGLQAPCAKENTLVEICNTVSDATRADVTSQLCDMIMDFIPSVEE